MLKSIHRIDLSGFAGRISPLEMIHWTISFAFGEPILNSKHNLKTLIPRLLDGTRMGTNFSRK
jgi:hypothetical protein